MEILQNSILKLVIRQGPDLDRKSIILDSGELGYTTDTNRVFVGDGFLSGGKIVGNLFRGSQPTITNVALWPSVIGDSAFATDTNKLYTLKEGNGQLLSDWLEIGGVYTSGDTQISISNDNKISLLPLSANFISNDAVTDPIYINSGKIGLKPLSANYISTDALTPRLFLTGGRLDLSPLSSNSIATDALSSPLTISNGKITLSPLSSYHISDDAVSGPIIISNGKISLSSTIPYQSVSTKTWLFGNGFNVTVGGINYNTVSFNPLSANVVIESNQIYAKYDALSGGVSYSKGTAYNTVSSGHYRFTFFNTMPTVEYIPIVQILGTDALTYQARVIQMTLTTCDVKVLDSSGNSRDANIILKIDY
jgi:hypothetical protein